MPLTISKTLLNIIVKQMLEKEVDTVTVHGITLSTEKTPTSLPTGETTKEGKMIYVQAWPIVGGL